MTFTGSEIFTVTNGTSPPCRKRLAAMTQFEVLCAANHCQRNGHHDLAAVLLKWQHRMHQTPRQRPPDAA